MMENIPFFLAEDGLSGFMFGPAMEEEEEEDENNNNVSDKISNSKDCGVPVDQNGMYQQYPNKSEKISKDGLSNTKSSELDMNSSDVYFSPLCISQAENTNKTHDADSIVHQRTSQGQIFQGKIPESRRASQHRTPQLSLHYIKESGALPWSHQEILSSHNKEPQGQGDPNHHQKNSQVLESYSNESRIEQTSHQKKSQALSPHNKELRIQQRSHQKKSRVLIPCNSETGIQQGSHQKKSQALSSDNKEFGIQQGSPQQKSRVLIACNNECGIEQRSHQMKSQALSSHISESGIQRGSHQKKSVLLAMLTSCNSESAIDQGSHQKKSQALTSYNNESGIQQRSHQNKSQALPSHNTDLGIIQQELHQKKSQILASYNKESKSQQGSHNRKLHVLPFHSTKFEIQQRLHQGTAQALQPHSPESGIQRGSHQKASQVLQVHSTEFRVQQEKHQKTSQVEPSDYKESEGQKGLHQKKSQVGPSDNKESGIQQGSHQKIIQVLQSQNTEFQIQQGSHQKKPQTIPSHYKEFGMQQESHQKKSQVLRSHSTQSGIQQESHQKASHMLQPHSTDFGNQYRSHQATSQKLLSHNREPGSEQGSLQKLTQMLPFHNREHEIQQRSHQRKSQERLSGNKESVIQLGSHQKASQVLPSHNREFRNQQGSHQKKSQLPPDSKESGIQKTSQLKPSHSTEFGIQQGSHQGTSQVSSELSLNKESGIQQASHHKTSQGLLPLNKTFPISHQNSLQRVHSPSHMPHAHARSHQKTFQTSLLHNKRSEIHRRSHQKAPQIASSCKRIPENLLQRASHESSFPGKISEYDQTFNQEASQSRSISKISETCQIPPQKAEQLLPSPASILEAFQATLDKTAQMLLSSINKSEVQQTAHQTTAQICPSKSESLPTPISDPSGHDSNGNILQTYQNSAPPSLDFSSAKSQDKRPQSQNEFNTKRDSNSHKDSDVSEETAGKIGHNHNVDSRHNKQMRQLKPNIKVIPTEGVLLFDHTLSPWPVCTESPPILNAGFNSSKADYQKPPEISLSSMEKHKLPSHGSEDPRLKEERPHLSTRINTGQEVPVPQHNTSELRFDTTDQQNPLSDLNNQAGLTATNQPHTQLENRTQNHNIDENKTQNPHSDSASVDRNDHITEVETQNHRLGKDTEGRHISFNERRIQHPRSHVNTQRRNDPLNKDRPESHRSARGMKRGHDHLNEARVQYPHLHKDNQRDDHLNESRVERRSSDKSNGRINGSLNEGMGRTESPQSDKNTETTKADNFNNNGFESPYSEGNAKGKFENSGKSKSGSPHSDKRQSNVSKCVEKRDSEEWKRPLKRSKKSPTVERELPGKKQCLGKISQRSRFGTFNRHKVTPRPRLAQGQTCRSRPVRRCRFCQFSTPLCNKLDEHLADVHNKPKMYFCSFKDCNLSFVLAKTLDAHESRHRQKTVPGPNCPGTGDSQGELHRNLMVDYWYSHDIASQVSYPTESQSALTLIEHQNTLLTDYQNESPANEHMYFSEGAGFSWNVNMISDYPLNRRSAHDTGIRDWGGEGSLPDGYSVMEETVAPELEKYYPRTYSRPRNVEKSVSPERPRFYHQDYHQESKRAADCPSVSPKRPRFYHQDYRQESKRAGYYPSVSPKRPRSYHQDYQRDSKRAADYPFVPHRNYRDQNGGPRKRNSDYLDHNMHGRSGNRWNETGHSEYYNRRDLDHYDDSRDWNGNGAEN